MASISFVDSGGAAALSNGKPAPADRFRNWKPDSAPHGEREHALGTGALYMFSFRDDHTASFEIPGIPNESMDTMLRLQMHLRKGGTVSVATDDAAARTYATCCLAPGAQPEISLSDPIELEYTFAVTLLNIAAVPVRMLCLY